MTVTGFQGYVGWDMAGVLSQDVEPNFGAAIGGFAAAVDSDDFTTT